MGFFALTLKYLNPFIALFCAFLAFLHNQYIFPLYGRKKIEKKEEIEKGYYGIVSYPIVVFFIILFSILLKCDVKLQMAICGASWAILAFGDSASAIFGYLLKGKPLPYNCEKTYIGSFFFLIFSFIFSLLIFSFILEIDFKEILLKDVVLIIFLSSFVSMLTESLKGQFDDNIGFPFVAFSMISFVKLENLSQFFSKLFISQIFKDNNFHLFFLLLFFNLIFAFLAFFKKWVDFYGFLFGLIFGILIILSLGIEGYLILLLFYILANFSTFYGSKIKKEKNIEEKDGGRRGIESIFSKGIAPSLLSFFGYIPFFSVLSFYASDTVATEFGKTTRGYTYSLITLRKVEAGKSGGVSFKGTLFGVSSILLFNYISLLLYCERLNLKFYLLNSTLILFFFFLESIFNELNWRFNITSKWVIHIVLGFLLGAFSNQIYVRIL